MDFATFKLNGHDAEGEVAKFNNKTVLIKLRRAGQVKYIKRHIKKHNVKIIEF